jgi:hypothetical protein
VEFFIQGGKVMNTDLLKDVASIAKEKHGDNWLAYLWGASQVLLNEKDLQIILETLQDN